MRHDALDDFLFACSVHPLASGHCYCRCRRRRRHHDQDNHDEEKYKLRPMDQPNEGLVEDKLN